MSIEIRRVTGDDAEELARICYEAFGALHDRHRVPRDFDSIEMARMVLRTLVSREDFAGFAAIENGRLAGSNFIAFTDMVAGVGPITVDPSCQARGVGRALMKAVLEEAERRKVGQVRLMQEAVNTASLSLYTSLGFDWREAVAVVELKPAERPDAGVRAFMEHDLGDAERLAVHHYHASRRNEAASALRSGMPVLARERDARVTGYLIPGFFGHGFAETREDMVALLTQAARIAPPMFHRALVPMSQQGLYRELLSRGARTVKVMNYMTLGAYDPPREAWIPSIGN